MTVDAALTVKPADTLRTAHERMRVNGRGLVAVVGRGGALLGTVTDGAIRRAVLAGADLDGGVDRAMSLQPLTASSVRPRRSCSPAAHASAALRPHGRPTVAWWACARSTTSAAPAWRRRSRS